ncbi:MAG TPA: peptidoglycan editing factor PgeF [Prolixibacteraceae bacterium]|nr:peptidoglycan editing factor PgeF [Prolixibacteraceae bacterium]
MRKLVQGRLSVFKFESFKKYKNIAHFITTKEGWVSGNKPRFTGNEESEYAAFRKELAVSGEWKVNQFVFPRQTHSDQVGLANSENRASDFVDTDALITNEPGLFVCVQTADCVPVLLYDTQQKVVAAIHAGWRGTVSKIVQKTILKMTQKYDCNPDDIIAGIGPSIHMHAYEVGPEVVLEVQSSFSNSSSLLKPSLNSGKAYFDLWEANKTILIESGVPEGNIEVMGLCSFEHAGLFYSARRDGADTGRMVSGIKLV